jgi:hypothetical protein
MPSPAWRDGDGLCLTGEENFRLTTFGSLASAVVALEGRLVADDGTIVPLQETQVPNSDRTAKVSIFPAGRGRLTNAQLRVSTGTAINGQVFALLELGRGREGGFQPLVTLIQGYITTTFRRVWPGSLIDSPVAGVGRPRTISGTDPIAGAEMSETVPAGARWLLKTFNVGFVASAAAANRATVLTIDDGANILTQCGTNVIVTAAQLAIYRFGQGLPFLTIGALHYNLPLPLGLLLGPGYRIRTITTNLQAGDDYTAPVYHVEEFIDG